MMTDLCKNSGLGFRKIICRADVSARSNEGKKVVYKKRIIGRKKRASHSKCSRTIVYKKP